MERCVCCLGTSRGKHLVIKHKCEIVFQRFELVKFSVFLIFISHNVSVEGILKYKSTFGFLIGSWFSPRPAGLPSAPTPCVTEWMFVGEVGPDSLLQGGLHFLMDAHHKPGNAFPWTVSRKCAGHLSIPEDGGLSVCWELQFSVFVVTLSA